MPRYIEVTAAARETATKLLALRSANAHKVAITTRGGKTASVDWSSNHATINMPSLPPDAILTRAEADRLVAFIAHECCHVLHSDRGQWQRACAAGARVQAWTNALEDVRIEAREIEAGNFPALRTVLAGMANHLHYEAVTAAAAHGRIIGAGVADAPYVACILGRVANAYAIPAGAGLAAGLSRDTRWLVDHALARIGRCKNTSDVVELALELVAIEQALPQHPQGDDAQGDDAQGDDAQGDADPAGDDDAQDDDAQSKGNENSMPTREENARRMMEEQGDDAQGDDAQGDADPAGDDDAQGDTKPGDGSGNEIASDVDLTDAIDAIAKRAGIADLDDHNATDKSYLLPTLTTKVTQAHRYPTAPGYVDTGTARMLAERMPRNSVLHGQIARLLVTDEQRRVTHHESSGRLDRRALARMRTGATDVYSRRSDTPGIDTALLILIDASSSMRLSTPSGHSRMELAQTTAWHIGRAAESANAKLGIASFHWRDGVTGSSYTELEMVKPWSMPMAACATAIWAIGPGGQTPLSPAIVEAANMLAGIDASRRIIMVLTDGDCDLGPATVTAACRLAAARGVETVGIGLNAPRVIAAFPPQYSINVDDLDQLSAKGLGVLVDMLEDANPTAAE
jgi:Mg-chelatase subunit ChlD